MPPRTAKARLLLACSILAALGVVFFAVLVATLGGFLNHCRGGYIHIGPSDAKPGSHVYEEWYWPQHILARLLFALPTGLLVILFGLHMRGALVVCIMTWLSLYVGWGSYMNVGMDDNYCSQAGAFDWLLGRQGQNWSVNERFVREYSGMSLRGLVWTLPQGYALEQMGFGWEYSLTGSVMPLVYYMGAKMNTTHVHGHPMKKLMDGTIAVSELLWGVWVWFVLIVACLAQAVRRARIWIYKRNPSVSFRPFSTCEVVKYESLNRPILRGFYEGVVVALTVVFCFTVAFYSLVEQPDLRIKGQTFVGLFTGFLFLVSSQAWMWGTRYSAFLLKRHARKMRGRTRTNNAIYDCRAESPKAAADSPQLARTTSLASDEDAMALSNSIAPSSEEPPRVRQNRSPVLSWPYSHPDRLSPTGEQRQQVLDMSEHGVSSRSTFMVVWLLLEKYVWLDLFIYARRTIGVVSLICTIFSTLITITAMIVGWGSPRFIQDLNPPCF